MDNENVVTTDNAQSTAESNQVLDKNSHDEHLFTQEQLNSIISGRINALNQKVTELSSQLAKSEKLTTQYHEELEGYKHKEIALKEGISAELVDYAIYGASKLVSKDKSFEDALKEFKESNKTLFGVTQQSENSENSSTQTNNNELQTDNSNKADTKVEQKNVTMSTGQNVNNGSVSVEEEVNNYLKDRLKRR